MLYEILLLQKQHVARTMAGKEPDVQVSDTTGA